MLRLDKSKWAGEAGGTGGLMERKVDGGRQSEI